MKTSLHPASCTSRVNSHTWPQRDAASGPQTRQAAGPGLGHRSSFRHLCSHQQLKHGQRQARLPFVRMYLHLAYQFQLESITTACTVEEAPRSVSQRELPSLSSSEAPAFSGSKAPRPPWAESGRTPSSFEEPPHGQWVVPPVLATLPPGAFPVRQGGLSPRSLH